MRLVVVAAGLALAGLYLLLDPPSLDLPAHVYRAGLADAHGWLAWENGWYGGHPLPTYSVLFPPLGALLGVRAAAAIAVAAGAWAAAIVLDGARRARPRQHDPRGGTATGRPEPLAARLAGAAPALLFALALAANAAAGRLPFVAGVAVGVWGVVAALRGGTVAAGVLGILTTAMSPVAGVFVALVAAAHAVAERRGLPETRASGAGPGRPLRAWIALAAGALAAGLILGVLFGQAGTEPFKAQALWPALAIAAGGVALAPPGAWRTGAAMYLVLLAVDAAVPNALGSNAARLAVLLAGPLAWVALWPRRRAALALLALPVLYLILYAPVRDAIALHADPSRAAAYFAPLLGELAGRTAGAPPARVEIPFTRSHWEAARVAPRFPLARGWERQLDRARNGLFYGDAPLDPATYRRWLDANAVRWVALPDVPFDEFGRAEARLVAGGLPYLRRVWRSAHWRLFEVRSPAPMNATALGADTFATRGGRVAVRWSPYWAVVGGRGCVAEAPGGWVSVRPARAGETVRVGIRFDPLRALSDDPRCD